MSEVSEYCRLKNDILQEQKNILQNGSSLATDAEINTMLQKFSLLLQRKSNYVATRMRCLETEIQRVDTEVNQVINDLLVFPDFRGQAGEFVASEKDNEVDGESYQQSVIEESRNSRKPHDSGRKTQPDGVDIAVEDRAIQLGIDALHLFKDSRGNEIDSGDFELKNEDCGDWDNDNVCNFQQCASGDIFNQRSIPFIIGSRNFMESASGE